LIPVPQRAAAQQRLWIRGADFVTDGILQYQFVRNVATGDTFAVATGGVAATTLTLVGTPSGASAFINGQGYEIYGFVFNCYIDCRN